MVCNHGCCNNAYHDGISHEIKSVYAWKRWFCTVLCQSHGIFICMVKSICSAYPWTLSLCGRCVYHIGITQVCEVFLKKMLPQSDSVLNGFGDDTFHASCTLVFYSYSDGNINTIHWSGRKNAVSTDIPNLADSAMYTPKICVFRSDRKKQLQKNK